MGRHVAFIRGINVGGHNLVRMQDLRAGLADAGFKNVTTYKQSGNVVFDPVGKNTKAMCAKIEGVLASLCGVEIMATVREIAEIQKIVQLNPFQNIAEPTVKTYVSLLLGDPATKPKFPLRSPKGEVEVLLLKHGAAFLILRPLKGRYTDPNLFLKSALGVSGTVRNWNTLSALAAMA